MMNTTNAGDVDIRTRMQRIRESPLWVPGGPVRLSKLMEADSTCTRRGRKTSLKNAVRRVHNNALLGESTATKDRPVTRLKRKRTESSTTATADAEEGAEKGRKKSIKSVEELSHRERKIIDKLESFGGIHFYHESIEPLMNANVRNVRTATEDSKYPTARMLEQFHYQDELGDRLFAEGYQTMMGEYTKRCFDMFARGTTDVMYHGVHISLCKLNYFMWALESGLIRHMMSSAKNQRRALGPPQPSDDSSD